MTRRALVLVALAACAPAVAYHNDPAFTASEQAEIAQAAATWNGLVKPEKRIHEGDAWLIMKAEPPQSFNGECHASERRIWIRPQPIGATVYAVALHELGHAVGLGHTTHGVMDPAHVTVEFSDEDRAECRRVGACP